MDRYPHKIHELKISASLSKLVTFHMHPAYITVIDGLLNRESLQKHWVELFQRTFITVVLNVELRCLRPFTE